jgi:ABC-type Mn2+/Zn2+ transport system permease subunit
MVLPVATGRVVSRSFRSTMAVSAAIGAFAVVVGLAAARQWALAPGGSIVLVAAFVFATVSLVGGRRRSPAIAVMPVPRPPDEIGREDGHDHTHDHTHD